MFLSVPDIHLTIPTLYILVGFHSYLNMKAPCSLILIGYWDGVREVRYIHDIYGFVPFGCRSKCCRPHCYRDYISLAMEALLPLALYLAYACSVRSALSWVSVRSTWALRNLLRLIAAISCCMEGQVLMVNVQEITKVTSASSICFL